MFLLSFIDVPNICVFVLFQGAIVAIIFCFMNKEVCSHPKIICERS